MKDKEFATQLHETICRLNHTDQCSWFYEKDWKGSEHKYWLGRIKEFNRFPIPREMILEILKCR